MTIPAYSLAEIVKLNPCPERWQRVKALKLDDGKITAKQAVKAGVTFDDLVWVASAISLGKDEQAIDLSFRLTGWMADVAGHVLYIFEKEYPSDDRPRKAIQATQQFIRGNISKDKWAASATEAAWAANVARTARAARAAWAAWAARAAWAANVARTAWAAEAARAARATEAAEATEHQWQFDRLVYWLSEEKPKFWPLPKKQERKAA